MADFSKRVELKYGTDTYEKTKQTYEWIKKSAEKWGGNKVNISISFQFKVGDVSCGADNLQEFSEIAYGASDYQLISFSGNITKNERKIYFFYLIDFEISSNKKLELETFLKALENTSLEDEGESKVTYIGSQVNIENQNNGTIVQGNNNIVASDDSQININTPKKESKLKKWLTAVGQNILSNWIWYLLTILTTALVTYFVAK